MRLPRRCVSGASRRTRRCKRRGRGAAHAQPGGWPRGTRPSPEAGSKRRPARRLATVVRRAVMERAGCPTALRRARGQEGKAEGGRERRSWRPGRSLAISVAKSLGCKIAIFSLRRRLERRRMGAPKHGRRLSQRGRRPSASAQGAQGFAGARASRWRPGRIDREGEVERANRIQRGAPDALQGPQRADRREASAGRQ